jgi:LysM repeat protein
MRNMLFRVLTVLLLAVIGLSVLPAPVAATGGDGRLNPEVMEYYTVYCQNDALDIYKGDGNLLNRVPLANLLGLHVVGAGWDIGRGMHITRYGDTIVVSGNNGNRAPQAGQKAFSLNACIGANGRTPVPVSPYGTETPFSAAVTGGETAAWYPVIVPVVYPQAGGRVHVVRPGENAFRIALAYGVSLADLAAANQLYNVDRIYARQVLVIPGAGYVPAWPPAQPGSGDNLTHVLQRGETLYRVALRYNVTVSALIAANHILDVRRIPAGTVLVIPAAG